MATASSPWHADALWREFDAKGISPGIIDEQEFDGKPWRVFFANERYDVCFCFTEPSWFSPRAKRVSRGGRGNSRCCPGRRVMSVRSDESAGGAHRGHF
jgi:hypothetical protein